MTERDIVDAVMGMRGVRGLTIESVQINQKCKLRDGSLTSESPGAGSSVVLVYLRFAPWTWLFFGWRRIVRKRAQRELSAMRPWGISIRVVG